jgi:tetrahydromethanopterin S-methyltransferase subunit B
MIDTIIIVIVGLYVLFVFDSIMSDLDNIKNRLDDLELIVRKYQNKTDKQNGTPNGKISKQSRRTHPKR